jgi:glycosyltransferase involved in cell wall biosynthesis
MSDGGSSDDTLSRARAFAATSGLNLGLFPGSDTGQSNGLNRALEASRGDIIGWMNASDAYCDGSLRPLVDLLETNRRVLLAYGHFETIDESGERIAWAPALPPWAWVNRHESFVTNAQAMLWRRELQGRIGLFDESLHRTMDYDLIQRLLDATRRGEAKRVNVTVGRFRRHEGQKTSPGPGDSRVRRARCDPGKAWTQVCAQCTRAAAPSGSRDDSFGSGLSSASRASRDCGESGSGSRDWFRCARSDFSLLCVETVIRRGNA